MEHPERRIGDSTGTPIGGLLHDNVVTVRTKPYEIKTVKVKFASSNPGSAGEFGAVKTLVRFLQRNLLE